ncbi:MAG: amidohydrolase family protein [Woeseia sp.]
MKRMTGLIGVFLLLVSAAQADTLIHAGRLIDGVSDNAATEMTIRIDNSLITAIEAGYTSPASNDRVIDLREHTVMPGLMDMHVHLTGEYTSDSRLKPFITNEADYAFQSAKFARRTLNAGFTTVRNVGDSHNVTVALKKAIQRGDVAGPNIITAAKGLSSTGGHGDPTNGWANDLMGDPGPRDGVVNSVADARKAVRQRYKDGADWIKITATGGVLSVAASGQNPQFTDEELKAIVDTAKDYGMRVAAHAHGTEGMKRAVNAGVASIEHGTYMDDEVMRLMKRNGTFYVPTIMAGNWVAEMSKIDGFFPELVRPKAAAIGPLIRATFAKAYKAGVPIIYGTDAAVYPHGDNARQFAIMVAHGMTAMDAIKSATSLAAEYLGWSDEVGALAPGRFGDLIAVQGDPLKDVTVLQNVNVVIKGGLVFRNDL